MTMKDLLEGVTCCSPALQYGNINVKQHSTSCNAHNLFHLLLQFKDPEKPRVEVTPDEKLAKVTGPAKFKGWSLNKKLAPHMNT